MAIIILIQAGHEFTYSGWSGGQIEIIGGASSGTVVQSNVKVCDSVVVHIINAVLLPSSPLSTIPSQPSHNEPGKLISFIFFLPASAWHNLSLNPFLTQHVWVSRVVWEVLYRVLYLPNEPIYHACTVMTMILFPIRM
jgi:hypothetical protein